MKMAAMDFLTRIVSQKREQVDALRQSTPLDALKAKALARNDVRHFGQVLSQPGTAGANIIAEIKRASPSKGPLRLDLDPAVLAASYQAGGAAALSVLTETAFFKGGPEDLIAARQATALPVLRKDFIIDDYQIWESAAMGADAVLLIVRILSDAFIADSLSLCRQLALDALVEVNSAGELDRAKAAGATLIGINNRDLASFATDTGKALSLAGALAPGQVAVAASGIAGPADIAAGLKAGIFNFLVGEHLVRAADPAAAMRKLLAPGRSSTGH